MKNLRNFTVLIALLLLTSCGCLLSQVPPQALYVNENCQVLLPDYRSSVIASDNCGNVTLYQTPAPGTMLGVDTPTLDVVIQGVDRFGLTSEIEIPVTLIDTIPPILEWVEGIAALSADDVTNAYKNWEQMVKYHGIAEWIYNQGWVPDTLVLPIEVERELWYFNNTIALDSLEYQEYLTFKNR